MLGELSHCSMILRQKNNSVAFVKQRQGNHSRPRRLLHQRSRHWQDCRKGNPLQLRLVVYWNSNEPLHETS